MARKPFPWIKLWFDILGDPKMKRLSIAERGCWDGILLLAGQSPIRGKLMFTETQSMTVRDISKALNLTNRENYSLKSCISKMIELHSLRWNEYNCLEVIHFKDRQEVYESDFKDYHKTARDKLLINSELSPDKLQKEVEGRGERKRKDIIPLPKGKGVPAKTVNGKGVRLSNNPLVAKMQQFLGYPGSIATDPVPNPAKEAKFLSKMLSRGFSETEIFACWEGKVKERGEFVSMQWVNDDIGQKGGKNSGAGPIRPKPEQARVKPIKRISGDEPTED